MQDAWKLSVEIAILAYTCSYSQALRIYTSLRWMLFSKQVEDVVKKYFWEGSSFDSEETAVGLKLARQNPEHTAGSQHMQHIFTIDTKITRLGYLL